MPAKSFTVKGEAEVEKVVTALKMYLDDTGKQSWHLGDNRYLYVVKNRLYSGNDKLVLFNIKANANNAFFPTQIKIRGNRNLKSFYDFLSKKW